MKKAFLSAFVVLILFFGCTTKTVSIKNYETSDIKKVNVGENLIKVGSNLLEDMKFSPVIDIENRLKKEEFYIPIKPPYDGIFDERDRSYFVIIDKHEIFSLKVDDSGKIINNDKYFLKDEKVFDAQPFYLGLLNSKLFEISYGGRLNDVVYLMYKEYYINVEDIKREISQIKPGFSERIAYDLKESDILVYKNFKFKVYDANSKNIEFEIVSDSY